MSLQVDTMIPFD